MCIFLVLNVEEHQKCFLKTRAVHNSCWKGNIDRSKNVLAETDMIYVYILRSKRAGKKTRIAFLKTRAVRSSWSKGNIDRSKNVLGETDMIYVYILRSKRGRTPEMLS